MNARLWEIYDELRVNNVFLIFPECFTRGWMWLSVWCVCGAHACICCSTCCTVPADYSMFTLNSTPLLYWSNGCSSLCCKHRVLEEDESVRYVYFCQTLSYSTLIVCDLMWRYGLTHLNSDLNIAYFTCSFWLTCNLGVRCVRFDPN